MNYTRPCQNIVFKIKWNNAQKSDLKQKESQSILKVTKQMTDQEGQMFINKDKMIQYTRV